MRKPATPVPRGFRQSAGVMPVGIVGVGSMGLDMALRLLDRGHAVRVRNIDPMRDDKRPRHTVRAVLCPTIAPQEVEGLAETLASHGLPVIDAPMSGGPQRARDGSMSLMSLMVACTDDVFQRSQGLLDDLSSRLFRVSVRPGDGARTKLVNKLLAAVNLAGAAEAMAQGLERQGDSSLWHGLANRPGD